MTSSCVNFAIIIQWIYFTIWKKIKKHHHHYNTILSLNNIISRHCKKSLIRSQIYHGCEELFMDTNYPILRRQERRSKYAVQLASWQLRSNSPKMSVSHPVSALVRFISYLHILSSNFRRCVAHKALCKIINSEYWQFFKICNFDFVLFWFGIWCESLVWVIMGRQGLSQNAGVLVVLVITTDTGRQ